MTEETARYLATYLVDNSFEFVYIDKFGNPEVGEDDFKEMILKFFRELP